MHPIDPLILSQTRTSFSLLVLLPLLVGRRGWQRIKLPAPDLIQCLVLGMFGVAASNYFYYVAIQRTSVAIAIIVQYTAPVWVLLYVVARRQQKLSLQKVAAVGVAIAGIALTIGIVGRKIRAALSSRSFGFLRRAAGVVLLRVLQRRRTPPAGPLRPLARSGLDADFRRVFWLFVNPPWKVVAAHYAPAQWAFLFVFSMISVLGSFSLYFLGLQHLEPTRAIIASCLEPVFSILLAAALLGEGLRPVQTLGIVLVLSAIVIVQLPGRGAAGQESVVIDPIE